MSYFTRKQRFKIALGGLLLLIGLVVLIFTFLVIAEKVIVNDFLRHDLLVNVMAAVGSLDILAGILLLRSK